MANIATPIIKEDLIIEEFKINEAGKGVTVGFIDARGKHVSKAQKLMGSDEEKYYSALMHVVCRIDGKTQPIEFYEELQMHNFSAIMVRLNSEGFTDSAKQK